MELIINDFNLSKTLECGQVFRYQKIDNNHYIVISEDKLIECYQDNNVLYIKNSENYEYWSKYFNINEKYNEIQDNITKNCSFMKDFIEESKGIYILNQSPLETIISFIISQNNRIPQIQRCIELICEKYGNEILYKNKKYYSFPSLDKLLSLSIDDFKECKVGFRANYIYDALQKINKYGIKEIYNHLTEIKGIGQKVEACIKLFAYHDYTVFPVDTWIRRTMILLFFNGQDNVSNKDILEKSNILGPYKGVAQQYLFYCREKINNIIK